MKSKASPLLCAVLALTVPSASSAQSAGEMKSGAVAQTPATGTSGADKSLPRFVDYPADEKFTGKPAPPILSSSEARRFRTIIRRDAAAGPNFAGQYTIAKWGCGSTCVGFAVVDARTGNIFFHPKILRAWQVPYQTDDVLQYRLDSRLLVIAGETEGPSGASSAGKLFYEWKNERFTLVGESEIQLEKDAPPLPPGMTLDDLCSGIENSLKCAQEIERYQLQKSENARRAKRSGARLLLRLGNGRWLTIKDDQDSADEASAIKYHFRDYLPEIGYFLIHRQFYEGTDYLMIQDQSGNRHELHDVPVISPDKRRLVTASNGVAGGYSPNAIQIWRLTDNGMELEQAFEPEGWGPSNPKWTDNSTIRLTKSYPVAAQGQPRTASVTLKRNGQWHLEEAATQ